MYRLEIEKTGPNKIPENIFPTTNQDLTFKFDSIVGNSSVRFLFKKGKKLEPDIFAMELKSVDGLCIRSPLKRNIIRKLGCK